jgi:hypothetical protein
VVNVVDDVYSDREWGSEGSGGGGGEAGGGGGGGDTMGRVRRRPNQVKKINRLTRGVSIEKEKMKLIKGNIMGNLNTMSKWIPTTISLMLRVITKEGTLDRLCR